MSLKTPPAYAENLAMLRTHIPVRPSRLDIHVSATPFSATLAAAPKEEFGVVRKFSVSAEVKSVAVLIFFDVQDVLMPWSTRTCENGEYLDCSMAAQRTCAAPRGIGIAY
jgi:hypothetical protein